MNKYTQQPEPKVFRVIFSKSYYGHNQMIYIAESIKQVKHAVLKLRNRKLKHNKPFPLFEIEEDSLQSARYLLSSGFYDYNLMK